MIREPGQPLPLLQRDAQIDEVPPEVLNQAVLLRTVGERLDDVPERRGVAGPTECLLRGRAVGVDPSETLVNKFLKLGKCGART